MINVSTNDYKQSSTNATNNNRKKNGDLICAITGKDLHCWFSFFFLVFCWAFRVLFLPPVFFFSSWHVLISSTWRGDVTLWNYGLCATEREGQTQDKLPLLSCFPLQTQPIHRLTANYYFRGNPAGSTLKGNKTDFSWCACRVESGDKHPLILTSLSPYCLSIYSSVPPGQLSNPVCFSSKGKLKPVGFVFLILLAMCPLLKPRCWWTGNQKNMRWIAQMGGSEGGRL